MTARRQGRRLGVVRVVAVASALAAVALGLGVAPSQGQTAAPSASGDGLTKTQDITRTFYPNGATDPTTLTNDVSVSVDKHTDLQARERVRVSWTGAHPTGGRVGNPYGENGLDQEYPVVILECRGIDSPTAPAAKQISPNTCFTNTVQERSVNDDAQRAIWRDDRYATEADQTNQISGIDPDKLPSDCPTIQDGVAYHFTPFDAAGGKQYAACDANHLPPEAAVGSVDPPNEVYAYTAPDGTGSAQFEVRTDTENASLGCSHSVACSLVVIPIMGLSCKDTSAFCNKTGAYQPGSQNDGTTGAQQAVSPALWWSASNWRNRFTIPLEFGLPASTCTLLGQGPPVPFYGSELLSQAALQWAPSYCLNKSRFNWQSNTMADDAAFEQMLAGTADAAEVTGKPEDSDAQIGFAPTAASGFGIAFNIDDPTTGTQVKQIKLDARLLAKLMTESYPADAFGAQRPGLENNPWSLQNDPEFQKLNPGLELPDGRASSQAAATLLQLSTGSGVMEQLTSYVASDPEAAAFIAGKPDPWGMRINPAYKKIDLPVSTWPLLDTWYPKNTGNSCLDDNPSPYLAKIAAPVNNLRQIAQAMLFNWPLVQTACERDPTTGLYKLGRVARQNIGQRFMLGLVTLGDAARYGLTVASLQAKPGSYVPATPKGISAAVSLLHGDGTNKPLVLDQSDVRKSSQAYPGAMVVYTAAKTGALVTKQDGQVVSTAEGLDATGAANVSQFIDVSSTEGQKSGRGNGQLPAGYLPITKSGPTAKLYAQAQRVGALVKAQKKVVSATGKAPADGSGDQSGDGTGSTSSSGTPGGTTPGSSTPVAPGPVSAPGDDSTPSSGPSTAAQPTVNAATVPTASTGDISSGLGAQLLPILLLIGLLAGGGSVLARFLILRRSGS